jgi:hypothetical protein
MYTKSHPRKVSLLPGIKRSVNENTLSSVIRSLQQFTVI